MCGIAGFAGAGGDGEDIRRMTAAMVHRGPDGDGFVEDVGAGVFFGHRRLAIVDLPGGVQPMWNADRSLCVIFNGEIYNHLDLRQELRQSGCVFQTDHSDTEVLLHAYRVWGGEMVSRLNGMWAFAIWDVPQRRLFLSRDRFGQKPLYYTVQNGLFAFASELKALTAHRRIEARYSELSLKKYFAYGFIPAPNSLYEGICKLPGGWNLTVDLETMALSRRCYWEFRIEPFEKIPDRAEDVWAEELLRLLRQGVKRQLMADVPLGIFLSGGIDSSAMAVLAAQESSAPIHTFAIGFEEKSFDESEYAAAVAQMIGSVHHAEILSMEKASELVPEILSRLDEPMGDSSLLPTWLLCRNTVRHVKVALGGDGGDELFAGYDPFRALGPARWYDRLMPRPLHRAVRLVLDRWPVSHANMSLDFKLKRTLRGLSYPPRLWNPVWLGALEPREITTMLSSPTDPEELYAEAIACWDGCRTSDLTDRTLEFYTRLYFQDAILTKVDRAGMLNSLEARSPFLDFDLIDFARRIPSRYKYRAGTTKYILKKALAGVLPERIIRRPKKGFGIPVGRWFRDGALRFDPDRLPAQLDRTVCLRLAERHRAGQTDERLALWNLLTLSASSRS